MKKFPFKPVLNLLLDVRRQFSDINSGGCGVMATILAYHLKPLVDDMRIVSADYATGNIDTARLTVEENTVRSWNKEGIRFNHVWVEFKWNWRWYTIDIGGIQSRRAMHKRWGKPYKGSFTLREMRQMTSIQPGWNSWFDRSQIPFMRRMVGRHFKAIKN